MIPADRRYSQHARRSLIRARLLAQEYQHASVETDHILLGIWRTEGSLGYYVLNDLGIERSRAENIIRQLHPQDPDLITLPPYSSYLQSVLHYATDESRWLGQHYIGTEHILLGLVRSGTGQLSLLLLELQISSRQIQQRIRRLLTEGAHETTLEAVRRSARLSELSRRVLNAATKNAQKQAHHHAGLTHLLLVLAQERRSRASQLLTESGFSAERLAHDLAFMPQDDAMAATALDDVLQRAVNQADTLGMHYTGTDHILLALLLDDEAAALIQYYGGDLQQLRRAVKDIFQP